MNKKQGPPEDVQNISLHLIETMTTTPTTRRRQAQIRRSLRTRHQKSHSNGPE